MYAKNHFIRAAATLSLALLPVVFSAAEALADGTETLGPPSILIDSGTDFVAAGVGLRDTQPAILNFAVPAGVTIEQVLLYWEGQMTTNVPGDNSILVDGNAVVGTLIGGPAFFFDGAYSSVFRADITSLGLITPGANALSIDGLAYDRVNHGAGIVVIYSDGGDSATLGIRDGVDLAFANFPDPRMTTVPQTFSFPASTADRTAHLAFFVSSAATSTPRPSSIEITVDGTTTVLSDMLFNSDGPEWDTLNVDVDIPAGATSLTVQIFSRDDSGGGAQPASIAWDAAVLAVPAAVLPPPPGGPGRNECGSFLVFPLIDNINYTTIVELANSAQSDVWLAGLIITHPPGQPTDFEKQDFLIHLTPGEPFWWDTSRSYYREDAEEVLTSLPGFDNRKGFLFIWAVDSPTTQLEIAWNNICGDGLLYGGGRSFQYNAITHRAFTVTGDRILNLDGIEYSMGYTQNMVEGFSLGFMQGLQGTWVVCSPDIDFIQSIQPEFNITLNVWNQDEVFSSRHLDFYQFQQYTLADLDLDIPSVVTPKWQFATSGNRPIWSIFYQTIGVMAWGTNAWYHPDTGVAAVVILPPVPQG